MQKVEWEDFFAGRVEKERTGLHVIKGFAYGTALAFYTTPVGAQIMRPVGDDDGAIPAMAQDASNQTWVHALSGILQVADWLNYGCIAFAAGTWMFGNRTKAIETLTGASIGYIILRHAGDIQNFLKGV